ncbi:LPXTG cell wall anchor domain-containing protein [Enterococcus sp. DIV1298c]|uniref:LPXTG cell wall anchor domain-containing protein n=1 Tax=Enterococcus sp. DIV1298c TaxID=2815328 RepID=UPI001F5D234F|nr:LPXTG cell wall anchor domain-containing protein [Enterococcus sp. DIV1298c]
MKRIICIVASCLLGILILGTASTSGNASSVQSTETEGTIRFMGRYEPEGTPDPPPTGIAKPPAGDRLPQTNTVHHTQWVWIGWLLVGLVATAGVKRNKKNKTN